MKRTVTSAAVFGAAGMLLSMSTMVAGPAQATSPPANPAARLGGPHLMLKIPPGGRRAPLVSPHLQYYGGPVDSQASVQGVFWGSGTYGTNAAPGSSMMPAFYNGVANSAYFDWLPEYDTPTQSIARGGSLGETTITPSAANDGATIMDSNMQAELAAQLAAGHLPAPAVDAQGAVKTIYALYFPDGKTLKDPNGQVGGQVWCAYHGTISYNGLDVPYMVLPAFTPGSGYAGGGCGQNSNLFNDFTMVTSHELVESVTDTAVGLASVVGPPLAWYDPSNGEIGDICNGQQGTITTGSTTWTVQKQWSNRLGACTLTSTTAGDFSMTSSPSSVSVAQGSAGLTTIMTAYVSGQPLTVTFSASGLPAGVTASFNPPAVTDVQNSTLTLTVSGSAATGLAKITVIGTTSVESHTTPVALTITPNLIVNGGFESGALTPWKTGGSASVVSGGHSGSFAAQTGTTTVGVATSNVNQTVTLPTGSHTLTLWYQLTCPDVVKHDYATVTVRDVTALHTYTVLPKTCTNDGTWHQITYDLTGLAGHKIKLSLTSHDDRVAGNVTYAHWDDISIS